MNRKYVILCKGCRDIYTLDKDLGRCPRDEEHEIIVLGISPDVISLTCINLSDYIIESKNKADILSNNSKYVLYPGGSINFEGCIIVSFDGLLDEEKDFTIPLQIVSCGFLYKKPQLRGECRK